jgi:tripartite-type tricarboxylate transporter receptor subunit TctC
MLKYFALAAASAAMLAGSPALAQNPAANYPSTPVKIIVTVPAGGGVDTVTRIFAEGLHQKLGQPFVIENRGGAGGNVGTEAAYTSPSDGYTLMASQPAPLTTNVALYRKLSFDPTKLEPVGLMSKFPNVLLVREDFPAKNLKEFMAYVKAHPGKVNFASQGIGTTSHLTAELYMTMTGTKMVHVPYRGTGPALNDIIAGHVDLIFMELTSAMKLNDAKKARILAVATDKRIPSLKNIPTLVEAGLPGFISDTWNAISAPPKTPAPIVAKLNKAMNEIIQDPAMKKRFAQLNLVTPGGSPEDLRKLEQEETKRWGEVIKKAGIKAH